MSNTPFVESQSSDPVERAIARKVMRILNDQTLDRGQRETLVRKAQCELLEHRKRQQQQDALQRQVKELKLPQGFRPQSITVKNGRVHLGAVNGRKAFIWLEAGPAPEGMTTGRLPFAPYRVATGGRRARKSLEQSIAERRKALGYQLCA